VKTVNNKVKKLEQLTSLRGIFIFLIVLSHTNGYFIVNYHEPLKSMILDMRYFGNQFFFVLSGFVLSLSYCKRIAENQISLPAFLFKRVRKLYPLYIVSNIVVLGIYTLQKGFLASFNLKFGIEVALMMSRGWINNIVPYNYPTWFLHVLLLCYLIYFFVARLKESFKNIYYFAIIFFIIWGYLLTQKAWEIPFCYDVDGEGLCCFFTGVFLYEIIDYIRDNSKTIKIASIFGLVTLLFVFAGSRVYSFEIFADDTQIVSLLVCPLIIFMP
jgi:Predicted acyltransferases